MQFFRWAAVTVDLQGLEACCLCAFDVHLETIADVQNGSGAQIEVQSRLRKDGS